MNPAQLLAHFDRISDAPDAIPRLRQLILNLAVRGKLVEQDQRYEPAECLLTLEQRVDAKRAVKPLSDDLPKGWANVFLGQLIALKKGKKPAVLNEEGRGLPYLDIAALERGELRQFTEDEKCPRATSNDLIVVCDGSRSGLLLDGREGIIGSTLAVIQFSGFMREYLRVLLNALYEDLNAAKKGAAIPHLNIPRLLSLYVDLPPLAEQYRIVAKVNELMALCDRLEASQAEQESRRDRLAASSLQRLNQPAEESSAFREHARFALDNLPRLTTRPEHIQQIRQTILNLAVRGKLVPQDPKDKPAPVFAIEKCAEEENRIQLRLPLGWSWVRVEDVAEARLGKMLDKAKNSGKAYRYLRNTNIHWFDVRMDELKDLRIEANEVEKYVLRNGDVLICEGGHGIGRTAVWRGMETNIIFQKALHRVRPGQALNSEFFAYCVCVYFHAGVLQSYFTGVGIPHFTGVALSRLVFPLPPINEQHRIVAKVEELMALCDCLEAQLTTTQTESRRLLEATLHYALSA
ncbi:MAG: restriction modification system DNA specificity domain [Nitrospira sp.]|nr:MAG: restriction modification system DNA specificity domain [Nitrospira sp.]